MVRMKAKHTPTQINSLTLLLAALALPLVNVGHTAEADFLKGWSVGDKRFGADLVFSATDTLKTNSYSIAIDAKGSGYLLGYSVTLGKEETKFEIPTVGVTTTSSGFLNVFGKDLAKWNEKLVGASTFRTPAYFGKQAGGKAKYGLGPVNITLEVAAEVSTYAAGSQSIEYSIKRPATKRIKAGPALDAAVSGSVSADVYVLAAGLDAALRLTGWALNTEVVVLPRADTRLAPQVSFKVSADTVSTVGYLEGWVRVGIKHILSKTFRKTFAEYNGGPTSTTLVKGTR